MARREFPAAVKKAVIKRAGASGMILCERCSGFARRFQIDHIIPDSHGGEPVLSNAQLICEACYTAKNAKDTTIAAKIKRQENGHLGIRKAPTFKSRGFAKTERQRPQLTKVLPPKSLYVEDTP